MTQRDFLSFHLMSCLTIAQKNSKSSGAIKAIKSSFNANIVPSDDASKLHKQDGPMCAGISEHIAARVPNRQSHKSAVTTDNECRPIRGDWFCTSLHRHSKMMGGLYLQENLCCEHEIHSPVSLCD